MPLDQYEEDDEKETGPAKRFFEFDCPVCNANNPYGDGFEVGDEVRCCYCGCEFSVRVTEEGKFKLKEI